MKRVGKIFLFCTCAIIAQAQDMLNIADLLHDRPETAIEILNRELEENPDSEELLKMRAEGYEIMKQHDSLN